MCCFGVGEKMLLLLGFSVVWGCWCFGCVLGNIGVLWLLVGGWWGGW